MITTSNTTQLRWSSIGIDSGNYRSTFRCGPYAVMFDDFYGRGKNIGIFNLDDQKRIKTYKFKLDESIVQFGFPYLVSKTKENIVRIWDVNSDSTGPIHEVDIGLRGLHRGVIHEGVAYLFSTMLENHTPQYMSAIECATGNFCGTNKLEGIDPESAVLFHQNCLIISQIIGGILHIIPFEAGKESRTIQTVDNLDDYAAELSEDDIEENVIRELVADGDILVGATNKVIRVWDFQSGALKMTFPTEEPCQLYSVEERFLFGTTTTFENGREEVVRVWDIATGNTLLQMKNTSSHPIPHCLWYHHKIFHVNAKTPQMPDLIVDLPVDEKAVVEEPKSLPDADSNKTTTCTIS